MSAMCNPDVDEQNIDETDDELTSCVAIEGFVSSTPVNPEIYSNVTGISHSVGGDFEQDDDFWSSSTALR